MSDLPFVDIGFLTPDFFDVELEISEERLEENARELEDDISLPLSLGFFTPYRLSVISTVRKQFALVNLTSKLL